MPALEPTDHYATVIWLGRVADRAAKLSSDPAEIGRAHV